MHGNALFLNKQRVSIQNDDLDTPHSPVSPSHVTPKVEPTAVQNGGDMHSIKEEDAESKRSDESNRAAKQDTLEKEKPAE